jgi:hypothetical protein
MSASLGVSRSGSSGIGSHRSDRRPALVGDRLSKGRLCVRASRACVRSYAAAQHRSHTPTRDVSSIPVDLQLNVTSGGRHREDATGTPEARTQRY